MPSYDTTLMKKAPPDSSLTVLQPIIEEALDTKLLFCSGNFYKHSVPYLPHTDYKLYQDNHINVVIPLQFIGTSPSLVIFDQIWDLDSVTWCMHHTVQRFETNTGVKGCPYDYPVRGLTKVPVDTKLYETHLTHYPRDTLFGLSGCAYPFEVGSIIVFDNRRIHCTSNFVGEKLGISLRFKLL